LLDIVIGPAPASVHSISSDGYRLTPLPQGHTTGGTPITIQAAATTWTRVRFQGFPRML